MHFVYFGSSYISRHDATIGQTRLKCIVIETTGVCDVTHYDIIIYSAIGYIVHTVIL